MKKIPELLAPAGSLKVLKAAVNTGADAVYFGLRSFSARSGAVNFSREEAEKGFEYLRARGKKGYVTINTLVKDNELNAVKEELKFLASVGADGVIVQDPGVSNLVRECVPGLPLHGSTQMTVHNLEGVEFLKERGFERVVLSRELPISDIEYIKKNTDCELEIFIHGALCVCYSGQCYLSSFIGERSGNRGKCAQPCRLPYSIGKTSGTLLSLKDMESTDYIEKIKELEIDSLKIEGRLKNEYYTSVVTDAYRTLLDGGKLSSKTRNMLFEIFNRGGYTEYFSGNKKDMFCFDKKEIPYNETEKAAEEKFRDIINDEAIPENAKKTVDMKLVLKCGEIPSLYGECDGVKATVYGEEKCEQAVSSSLNRERIEENLSKLKNTIFKAGVIEIESAEDVFVRISEINSLRRKLTEQFTEEKKYDFCDKAVSFKRRGQTEKLDFAVSVRSKEQYEWAKEKKPKYIIARPEIILSDSTPDASHTVVVLPPVIHERETAEVKKQIEKIKELGIRKAYCENISHFVFLKDFEIIAGSRINLTNSESALFIPQTIAVTVSKELNLKEISYFMKDKEIIAEGYGYQSMMITENCIKKSSLGSCPDELKYMKDRRGALFPILCEKGCRNEILNSCPTVMTDKTDSMKKSGINCFLASFSFENPSECERVFQSFVKGENPFGEFTRGHFFRGVL